MQSVARSHDRPEATGGSVQEHRTQVGVECPQCHFRQFMEVDSDLVSTLQDSKVAKEIYAELQAWMVSRCPDHLKLISGLSKN